MSAIKLFSLASEQARWLALRQSAVASNIANANTPGYKAVDVQPFSSVLESQSSSMHITNARHLNASGLMGMSRAPAIIEETENVSLSGNSVSIEKELIKGSEIAQSHALNTGVVKAFHRMLLMSVKG